MCRFADVIYAAGLSPGFEPDLEYHIRHPVFNGVEHLVEHAVSLSLILNLRVLLRHRPHPDTAFQMVHRVKMVLPRAVINLQQDISFEVTQLFPQILSANFPQPLLQIIGL